jgi:hypothetical protein
MKLFSGIITLLTALLITATAAWFSVSGLIALFAATAIPVLVMGSILEFAKIVAAAWLHINWHNKNVNRIHKTYLSLAIVALMIITAIGIYGFLSKGHLEQQAPVAGIELQINAKQQQVDMLTQTNQRLTNELTQMDQSVNAFLTSGKASAGLKARQSETRERQGVQKQIDDNNAQIQKLEADMLPLKSQTAEVEAKLGPVKYVAQLFGWQDTDKAVRLVILTIMFAFDPLAIMLLISSQISFEEWIEQRNQKKAQLKVQEEETTQRNLYEELKEGFEQLKAQREEPQKVEEPVEQPLLKKGDTKVIDGVTWFCTDPDLDRWVTNEQTEKDFHVDLNSLPVVNLNRTPRKPEINTDPEARNQLEALSRHLTRLAEMNSTEIPFEEDDEPEHQTIAFVENVEEEHEEPVVEEIPQEDLTESHEDSQIEDNNIHDIALVDALHELAEEHSESKPTDTTPESPLKVKERLIEIFEDRPSFLQELIDVISDHIDEQAKQVQPANEVPKLPPVPQKKPTNWIG